MHPYYETRFVPHNGRSGTATLGSYGQVARAGRTGLFATQNMGPGVRIICEPALIAMPRLHGPTDIWRAFTALDTSDQDLIMSLNWADPSTTEELEQYAIFLNPHVETLRNLDKKPTEQRTAAEEHKMKVDMPIVAKSAQIWRFQARWNASRRSMRHLTGRKSKDSQSPRIEDSLFLDTARLRHSCAPNCIANYNPRTECMAVQTIKPVRSGEELTLSTVKGSLYRGVEDRYKDLISECGMSCVCEACNIKHRHYELHESNRNEAYARLPIILVSIFMLEDINFHQVGNDLRLDSKGDSEAGKVPDHKALKQIESNILDLIKNVKESGGENHPELIRWYHTLIDRVLPRLYEVHEPGPRAHWWKIILRHALVSEKIAKIVYGEDTEEYDQCVDKRKGVEFLLERAGTHLAAMSLSGLKLSAAHSGDGQVKDYRVMPCQNSDSDLKKAKWKRIVTVGGVDCEVVTDTSEASEKDIDEVDGKGKIPILWDKRAGEGETQGFKKTNRKNQEQQWMPIEVIQLTNAETQEETEEKPKDPEGQVVGTIGKHKLVREAA